MLNAKDKGIILMILNHCERITEKIENVVETDFYDDNDFQEFIYGKINL